MRAALAAANANSPKGAIEDGDQPLPDLHQRPGDARRREYQPLIIAYRNGAAVRLSDVAEVVDSVEDVRNLGLANGKPAVLVILYRQPGANIIDTVDRVKALHAGAAGLAAGRHRHQRRPTTAPRPSAPRCTTSSARC